MDRKRILFVGLQKEEIQAIKKGLDYDYLTVVYDMLPEVKLQENILYVENQNVPQQFLKVDKVIFHGIYENDFDFITQMQHTILHILINEERRCYHHLLEILEVVENFMALKKLIVLLN